MIFNQNHIDVLTKRVYILSMTFEWDDDKNKINIQKHGFDFSDAKHIFEDPYLVLEDKRKDYGEKRFIAVGWINSRLVILIYTKRKQNYRIISLRKANEREKKKFQNRLDTS